MRVGVDTNVLVRYLTWDDDAQAEAAARVIEGSARVVIPSVVLCELIWVLRRAYRYAPDVTADIVRRLMATRQVEVDRQAAEAGLRAMDAGGDFADGVIADAFHRAAVDRVATFDRDFARSLPADRVMLLGSTAP